MAGSAAVQRQRTRPQQTVLSRQLRWLRSTAVAPRLRFLPAAEASAGAAAVASSRGATPPGTHRTGRTDASHRPGRTARASPRVGPVTDWLVRRVVNLGPRWRFDLRERAGDASRDETRTASHRGTRASTPDAALRVACTREPTRLEASERASGPPRPGFLCSHFGDEEKQADRSG